MDNFIPSASVLFLQTTDLRGSADAHDEHKIHTDDVIFLDFAMAFGSVSNRCLLSKAKSFGIGDVVVRWIEACLTGRVSRVQVDGELSGTIPLRSGVPFPQNPLTAH